MISEIIQVGTDTIEILVRDSFCFEEQKNKIMNRISENRNCVFAIFSAFDQDQITYQQALELDADGLSGIVFPLKLISKCGYYNDTFRELGLFELLCRLTKETETCEIIGRKDEELLDSDIGNLNDRSDAKTQDIAYLYAYVIRSHMENMRKLGILEQVFTDVCLMMQKKGCFSAFQAFLNQFMTDEKAFEKIAMETAPFVILRGDDTCGGVLRQFADDLMKALIHQNQAVVLVSEGFEDYESIQHQVCKGVIGFQAPALEIDFFRKLHCPKFQFWFDNPLHFSGILRNLPRDHYILCQDAYYASYIREYYHTPIAIQFPPGGIDNEDLVSDRDRQEVDVSDRPYDIVFIGCCFPDEGDKLQGEQREFYEFMIAHPLLTFEEGLCNMRYPEQEKPATDKFISEMIALKPACRSVIGYFRNKVVSTILQAGFSLHVYGEEWKQSKWYGKEGLVLHPFVPMKESVEEFKKAKIGLNVMSWHKAGMTERIANILLSGAVCLTDETAFLTSHMTDGEDIAFYQLDKLEHLPVIVRELLEKEERRKSIAQKGYDKAKEEYTWSARAKELIHLATEYYSGKNVSIFVATHVPFSPPNDEIYIPLQVGKKGKKDLGYLGDDTGENISDLNFLYGELTGLFWIWQNVRDVDYIGLCHYRRYFINDKMQVMTQEEYLSLLENCDAIVPKHMECEGGLTYYEHFGKAHNCRDLDAVKRALERLYPEYLHAYEQAMAGNIFYWGNLVVTSAEILRNYAQWLFHLFAEAGEEIDVTGYDDYHKRVYGFLSEQMFYVYALKNELKLCEVSVGVSAEKAETADLKRQLQELIKIGKKKEALSIIEDRLKNRPDLLLQGSDIKGELGRLYEELRDSLQ